MMPDRLTFSGKFAIIGPLRVAARSMTLVGVAIIYSKEYVKQNSNISYLGEVSL